MGGSEMDPPTLPPRPHVPPTRATRTVPRSASAAVWPLPPTSAEVLEGGLRDIAFAEREEVPGGPWGWPGGVLTGGANFGPTSGCCCAAGAAKLTKPHRRVIAQLSTSRMRPVGALSDDERKSLSVCAAAIALRRRNRVVG